MGIRKLQRKLNSKGETLVETLVAILLAALVLSMLVSMIAASTRIVGKSEKNMADYYKEEAAMKGTPSGTAVINIVDTAGEKLQIAGKETFNVNIYKNESSEKTPVVSYALSK